MQRVGQSAFIVLVVGGVTERYRNTVNENADWEAATFQAKRQGARTPRRTQGEDERQTLPWARKKQTECVHASAQAEISAQKTATGERGGCALFGLAYLGLGTTRGSHIHVACRSVCDRDQES